MLNAHNEEVSDTQTYPLYSLSLKEVMKLRFKVTDCITRGFEGHEFLNRGDLGVVTGLNKPVITSKAEQVITRIFDTEACVLVRGTGSGAIRLGLHAMLTCGGKILVHKVPVYNTTGTSFNVLGLVPVEADFNDLPDVEIVPCADPDTRGALAQHTRQKLDDCHDMYEVVKTIKAIRDIPVLIDDNYVMTKVKDIGIQCGADLSRLSAFKLLGPEGIGVIAGKKQYMDRLISESYSGGMQTQGYEALDVLHGLIHAPVAPATQVQVNEECINRFKAGEISQVRDAFLANAQSEVPLVESYENIAEKVLEEVEKLGAAPNPVGAEPKYEMIPMFYRVSETFRKADPTLEHRMIRINPTRAEAGAILRITKESIERVKQMFLNQTIRRNRGLAETVFMLHQKGRILPDSYVVDVDVSLENARRLLHKAEENHTKLCFMLKQIGRNPCLAKALVELGYSGAVVVDYREGLVTTRHDTPIGNVGHLAQIPGALTKNMMAYGLGAMTVYSREKIIEIQVAAAELGRRQALMLRVYGDFDMIYSGQTADFHLDELEEAAIWIKTECPQLEIKGVTSFPCYLYDEAARDVLSTRNLETIKCAAEILKICGIDVTLVSTPSATCCHTIDKMVELGGNCGEPRHGLSGTTPVYAEHDLEEIPAAVYVNEVSHSFMGNAYCFGGGHYRRPHVKYVLVGKSLKDSRDFMVISPTDGSIDYHLGISEECTVGDTAVMAFRSQIFVTRSDMALMKGVRKGYPGVIGIYDSQGKKKEEL